MSRRKHIFILLLAAIIIVTAVLPVQPPSSFAQTVPTRTPTPPPPTPTSPPASGGGSQPAATNTPASPGAATATPQQVPVTLAATPEGGFLPTAEPCGENPTIQAVNPTFVRAGPGLDYDLITELVYLEVRQITGRSGTETWWQISLEDGSPGWVSDAVVLVQGNVSAVPIVPAPPINGVTPTPGAPWTPVLILACAILPTWTPTPTPTAVPPSETPTPTPEPTEAPTETAVPATETPAATEIPQTPTPLPTAEPLQIDSGSSAGSWLPIAAFLLIGGGVAALLIPRLRNRG